MVHLVLSSTKGNQGLKYFPYTGYLGLTPVRVEGVVRTRLDADQRQLHAKSLTVSVRCYESRVGRVNTLYSNLLVDYTETLWSKPDDKDYDFIGNLEYPFRISLPAKIAGFSTAVFVDYRCMWRVEAVLTHAPISGVGTRQIKHFELPLIRYDLPPHIPTPSTPHLPPLEKQTTKPRVPKIRYTVSPPTSPVGPLDLVPIPIHLLPLDNTVSSIRSATVSFERRIVLNDPVSSASSLPSTTPPLSPQPSPTLPPIAPSSSQLSPPSASSLFSFSQPQVDYSPLASTSSLSSSNPTITPGTIYPSSSSLASETRPLLSPSPNSSPTPASSPLKVISNTIVSKESTSSFSRDANGVWSKTVTLQWPAAKSHSRWTIGETIQSDLVSVKFFVKVKIGISSTSGTDSVELEEKELMIVSTNDSERQLAIAKYNELYESHDHSGRSKSKSPRRSRIPLDGDIPPSPAPSSSHKGKSTSHHRRPHTSAGPRDKSSGFGSSSSSYGRPRESEREVGTSSLGDRDRKRNKLEPPDSRKRPDSSQSSETKRSSSAIARGFFSYSSSNAPRVSNTVSNSSSTSTTASSSSISSSSNGGESESDQHMREWEEELARIEMRSRRSSELLGFAGKRKRSAGAPRVVVPGEESV